MPTNYVNMVENRAIRQAKYKALTSSYQAGGRDQQPTSTGKRNTSRVEICGAVGRPNIVIWWHNNQNSNAT